MGGLIDTLGDVVGAVGGAIADGAKAVAQAVDDGACGVHELVTGDRKAYLEEQAAKLRFSIDDIRGAEHILRSLAESCATVHNALADQAGKVDAIVTFEAGGWFAESTRAARNLGTILGTSAAAGAILIGATGVVAGVPALLTAASVLIRVAGRLALAAAALEIIVQGLNVAHIRGELSKIEEGRKEIAALLPAFKDMMTEVKEYYAEKGAKYGRVENGRHILTDREGLPLVMEDFLADLDQLSVLIEQQGSQDRTPSENLERKILETDRRIRLALIASIVEDGNKLVAMQRNIVLATRMFRKGKMAAEVLQLTGVDPALLAKVEDYARQAANDDIPILKVWQSGEITVENHQDLRA